MNRNIKKCMLEVMSIRREIEKYENDGLQSKKIDDLQSKLSEFEENVYAKTIFDVYSKKQPKLIRVRTKETVEWQVAFGSDFSKLVKSEKYSLIGLFEDGGKYKLK